MERKPTTARKHGLIHLLASSRLRGGEKTNDSKKAWSYSLTALASSRLRGGEKTNDSKKAWSYSLIS